METTYYWVFLVVIIYILGLFQANGEENGNYSDGVI